VQKSKDYRVERGDKRVERGDKRAEIIDWLTLSSKLPIS
jgi:hypothetical protein